jgi:hypothetical protein
MTLYTDTNIELEYIVRGVKVSTDPPKDIHPLYSHYKHMYTWDIGLLIRFINHEPLMISGQKISLSPNGNSLTLTYNDKDYAVSLKDEYTIKPRLPERIIFKALLQISSN